DRRPVWAGAALGFAVNIKYLPVITLPYLLLRRRWVSAGAMALSCVAFALMPAIATGWHRDLRYLSIAFAGLFRMLGAARAGRETAIVGDIKANFSLSVTSAIARFAHHWHADMYMPAAVAAIFALVVACFAWLYRINK